MLLKIRYSSLKEEKDYFTEVEVKERASETKKRYQKFAELLEKKDKLDDYYLKIDREKKLLVIPPNEANKQA